MEDGRISIRELAERVALSTSATSERVRRLERRGVVTGYRAVPVSAATGRRSTPSSASAPTRADRQALERWFGRQPCIVEAVHLTGPHDYPLRALRTWPSSTPCWMAMAPTRAWPRPRPGSSCARSPCTPTSSEAPYQP